MPAAVVEEVDFGPLLRAREDAGPNDAAVVATRRKTMLATLTGLTALHGTATDGEEDGVEGERA